MRGLPYMPLQIERLQKSKAWLVCKRRPDLAFYILNLWMRAWSEVPAGSIEDDDDVLADAAMCPPDKFGQVKDDALRGWILCSDGRWYHPTVCEIAIEVWEKRTGMEKKRAEERERKRREREALRQSRPVRDMSDGQNQDKEDCPSENALKVREEKGREGKGRKDRGADAPPLAFVGKVIRLTFEDYERWRTTFSAIPDMRAELEAADAHYAEKPPPGGKWFFPVSNWLKRAHEQALAKRTEEASARRTWN